MNCVVVIQFLKTEMFDYIKKHDELENMPLVRVVAGEGGRGKWQGKEADTRQIWETDIADVFGTGTAADIIAGERHRFHKKNLYSDFVNILFTCLFQIIESTIISCQFKLHE